MLNCVLSLLHINFGHKPQRLGDRCVWFLMEKHKHCCSGWFACQKWSLYLHCVYFLLLVISLKRLQLPLSVADRTNHLNEITHASPQSKLLVSQLVTSSWETKHSVKMKLGVFNLFLMQWLKTEMIVLFGDILHAIWEWKWKVVNTDRKLGLWRTSLQHSGNLHNYSSTCSSKRRWKMQKLDE